MKRSLGPMWRGLIVLALVLSFLPMTVGPVAAATAVTITSVTPDTRLAAATTAKYTIVIVTATDLVGDTDTISIVFPTGMTPSATAAAASDVTINGTPLDATSKYVVSGQRLQLEVPQNVSAGTVTVIIGVTNTKVTNPAAGSYTLDVYTSKDTTSVTSAAIVIGTSADSTVSITDVSVAPDTVGVAGQYDITITTQGTTLAANTDTITVTFPTGTTVPTSISSSSYVTIGGTDLDATSDYSVSGQVVTLTVPTGISAASGIHVIFLVGANIINPETSGTYGLTLYTTHEPIAPSVRNYDTGDIVAGTGSLIALTAPTTFNLSTNVATTFTVKATDSFGNLTAAGTPTILFQTSSASGSWSVVSGAMTSGALSSNYTDTTAGTYTVTIQAVPQTTYTNTITQSVVVNTKPAIYHGTTLIASYDTIQLAINAAVDGDTIKVSPGTYAERLIIDQKITLTGVKSDGTDAWTTGTAGADSTAPVITYDGSNAHMIAINADNVTIQGFKIDMDNAASRGVFFNSGGAATRDSPTIQYNTFLHAGGDRAISISDDNVVNNFTITYNRFTGDATTGGNWVAIGESAGVSGTNVISYNVTTGVVDAPMLLGTRNIADITFSNNTLNNSIYFLQQGGQGTGGDIGPIVITKNTFSGIAVDVGSTIANDDFAGGAYDAADLVVRYNDFTGTTLGSSEKTIYFDTPNPGAPLNAQYNYWGSATGPTGYTSGNVLDNTVNPSGTTGRFRVAASGDLDYSPWLSASQATVIASGKSQYATSVVLSNYATLSGSTYSGGWNTFSTPIWLDPSADTWGEITALVTLDYVVAYGFDGTAWTTLTSSSSITPLEAIFVQLKTSAQSLPILYNSAVAPKAAATKTMHTTAGSYTGWELVGQANLTVQDRDDTLASLGTVAGADLKYSQVIDPISGTVITVNANMDVGKGYWVFVTADSTLAGFSVTPVPYVAAP